MLAPITVSTEDLKTSWKAISLEPLIELLAGSWLPLFSSFGPIVGDMINGQKEWFILSATCTSIAIGIKQFLSELGARLSRPFVGAAGFFVPKSGCHLRGFPLLWMSSSPSLSPFFADSALLGRAIEFSSTYAQTAFKIGKSNTLKAVGHSFCTTLADLLGSAISRPTARQTRPAVGPLLYCGVSIMRHGRLQTETYYTTKGGG